ncbi:hypothetical protein [Ectobacillus antri]|uniref:hypothetical protein n=1 Tax=Ectobacillus antri TaxID=2486280 RepID=UPI000F5A288E|nr:hypothetical protein [Ectobacillus antri]
MRICLIQDGAILLDIKNALNVQITDLNEFTWHDGSICGIGESQEVLLLPSTTGIEEDSLETLRGLALEHELFKVVPKESILSETINGLQAVDDFTLQNLTVTDERTAGMQVVDEFILAKLTELEQRIIQLEGGTV